MPFGHKYPLGQIPYASILFKSKKTAACGLKIYLRVWFNGRTLASQARNEGSIPFTRSKRQYAENAFTDVRAFCYVLISAGGGF